MLCVLFFLSWWLLQFQIVELDENLIPNLKAKYESTSSQMKTMDKEIKEASGCSLVLDKMMETMFV